MTMRIVIVNEDHARTAKLSVQDFNLERRTIHEFETRLIGPGERSELYIHAARQVIVTEEPLAVRRATDEDGGV